MTTAADTVLFQYLRSDTRYPDSIVADYAQPEGSFADHGARLHYSHETRDWYAAADLRDLGAVAQHEWALGADARQRCRRAVELRARRIQVPADQLERRLFSALHGERQRELRERPGGEMQPVDAAFAAGEAHARSRRSRKAHCLHDECPVVRRLPCEEGIDRAAVVIECELDRKSTRLNSSHRT